MGDIVNKSDLDKGEGWVEDGVDDSIASSRPSRETALSAVRTLLSWIGEDPDREGLRDTPSRVIKSFTELYSGYTDDPVSFLSRTFEDVSGYNDMIVVKDIVFHSHCEHHMVPIIGKVHVGYLPDSRVVGLSKIARVVDIFARRLQTQESMTEQIAQTIQSSLQPRGVAVMVEAEHMCMVMRGVRKHGAKTLTTSFTGCYEDDSHEQLHFISLAKSDGAPDES